jgi:hypothetical protein
MSGAARVQDREGVHAGERRKIKPFFAAGAAMRLRALEQESSLLSAGSERPFGFYLS